MEQLNYKHYGEGQPVIILHGLLGMLDNWHSFAKKLSEHYSVYTVDQRNHGKSFHSEDFTYPLLANDLKNFIVEHDLAEPHLIGHSMGGKTVMQFLANYPGLAGKSVVVDISPASFGGGHELIFNSLLNIDVENLEKRKDAQDYLLEQLGQLGTVFFLLKNLGRKKEGGFEWKANIKGLFDNYEKIKAEIITVKTLEDEVLFIKGELSKYIQDSDLIDIKNMFLNSKVESIEGAGHWVHADKPNELLELVLKFLK